MRLKALVIFPALALLTGCSLINQSPAEAQVILGCDVFYVRYESNDSKTPVAAMRHFAKAARLDSGYIPLAKAAKILNYDWRAEYRDDINFPTLRFDAFVTVNGVCTK